MNKEFLMDFVKITAAVVVGEILIHKFVYPNMGSVALGETDYDPTHEFPVVMGPDGPEYYEGGVATTPVRYLGGPRLF